MSGQYVRLPDSKRNELIAKFHDGVVDPDYEVIPSKNTQGRYTIRRRKVPLPVPDQQAAPQQEQAEPQEEQEEPQEDDGNDIQFDPYLDDRAYMPQVKLNKNAMFREMQLQMNRMMIENMKLMRQQVKQTEKKRQKLKEKSKRMSEFLSKVLDEAEQQPAEEPAEEQHEEDVPDDTVEPVSEDEEVHEEVVPAARQLTNQYEEKLNQLAGDGGQSYSRRDRLHFERFNI